jgi:hypothetical protein
MSILVSLGIILIPFVAIFIVGAAVDRRIGRRIPDQGEEMYRYFGK